MTTATLPQITTQQAAALCGVTWKTINRWIHSGLLKAELVGGRYRTTEEWIREMGTPVHEIAAITDDTSNEIKTNSLSTRERQKRIEEAKQRLAIHGIK